MTTNPESRDVKAVIHDQNVNVPDVMTGGGLFGFLKFALDGPIRSIISQPPEFEWLRVDWESAEGPVETRWYREAQYD